MKSNNRVYSIVAVVVILVVIAVLAIAHYKSSRNTGSTADLSQPASLTLVSTGTTNTVSVGDLQHIRWTSTNYGASTVAINIIRKVGDNPTRYELVRQVASATSNDGDAVWVPALTDAGENTYVEVACVESDQACTASPIEDKPLAVVNDGRYSNTASAYQAIEAENNN